MTARRIVWLALCFAATALGMQCPGNQFNGADSALWTKNGAAYWDNTAQRWRCQSSLSNQTHCCSVVLTADTGASEAGTLWLNQQVPFPPDPTYSFSVQFEFKLTTSGDHRADGIAFALQTTGKTAVGEAYGVRTLPLV